MLAISQKDTELILSEALTGTADSNLGYFSKPFRIRFGNDELMLKKYFPLRNRGIIAAITDNHEKYVSALRSMGINIPDTLIQTVRVKGKHQIIILQEAFKKTELLRAILENSSETELLKHCLMVYDDVMKFHNHPGESFSIGFHPTLRNYAVRGGCLYFFDTFPPMLMDQKELNKVIIRMSPFGSFVKFLIPPAWINIVTNEYFNFEKMFTGVTGSCCRLRPEFSGSILRASVDYINNSSCSPSVKMNITKILSAPPELPGLWTFFRRLSGNTGKPNIGKQRALRIPDRGQA